MVGNGRFLGWDEDFCGGISGGGLHGIDEELFRLIFGLRRSS